MQSGVRRILILPPKEAKAYSEWLQDALPQNVLDWPSF